MVKNVDIKDYVKILVKRRGIITFNMIVITLLAIVISFFLPYKWTAETTILPPTEETSSLGISSLLGGGLGGVVGGGALSRMLPGMATPSDLFAKELESRRIMEEVIKKNDLLSLYKIKLMEDGLEKLRKLITIEVGSEGIISISVTERSPELASQIANCFIEELDRFNRDVNMTVGKKNRLFLENRLETVEKDLQVAEESLRVFQERHRTVSLPDEMTAAIEAISDLKAQIMAYEVKLGMLYKYSSRSNPEVIKLQRELSQLRKKEREIESTGKGEEGFGAGFSMPFSEVPKIAIEYARRERDLMIQEAVYELIIQQYEQAKIMEVKNTPTVQVLDRATPPQRRSFPRRRELVTVAFFLSLFVGTGLAFLLEYVEKIEMRKEGTELWEMRKVIKEDFDAIRKKIRRRKNR